MKKYAPAIVAGLFVLFGGLAAMDLADLGLQAEGKTGLKYVCDTINSNNVLIEAGIFSSVSNSTGKIACSNLLVVSGGTVTVPGGSISAASLTAATAATAINGTSITNLNAANIQAGTAASAFNGLSITNLDAANIKVATKFGAVNGSSITNLAVANMVGGYTGTATNNFILYITNGVIINATLP